MIICKRAFRMYMQLANVRCTEALLMDLVAPLYEQGAVLAKHLAGVETGPYEGSILYTKLKVSGVDVFSGGQFVDAKDQSDSHS